MPTSAPTGDDRARRLRQAAARLRDGRPVCSPEEREGLAVCLESVADLLAPQPQAQAQAPASPSPDPGPDSASGGEMVLHSDGASRGNPGPAGAGALLSRPDGSEIARLTRYLGRTTNNVAEYQALVMGLGEAAARGASGIQVYMDSELIVRQLEGRYQVKSPQLKPLYEQARRLLGGFAQARVSHVPRGRNAVADELANLAIDQGGKGGSRDI